VLLFTIFVIVVTQKLVLSKNCVRSNNLGLKCQRFTNYTTRLQRHRQCLGSI